jgi:hypothetical protein
MVAKLATGQIDEFPRVASLAKHHCCITEFLRSPVRSIIARAARRSSVPASQLRRGPRSDARHYRPLFVLDTGASVSLVLVGWVTICRRGPLTLTCRNRRHQAAVSTRSLNADFCHS